MRHRDVVDVRRPDLIGPCDGQVPQQIRINLVSRRSIGYANVESKERFPHSHSRDDGDENKLSTQSQNRETPVISG
jgi:hypothetical protein